MNLQRFKWFMIPICLGGGFDSQVVYSNDFKIFEIQVLDAETQRGLPLVEMTTTHSVKYVTDNLGRIAYNEPDHTNLNVFFHIEAHGYEIPQDGLGNRGVKIRITSGGKKTIKLKRINLAERLYRITGEGRYRHSKLLGYKVSHLENLDDVQIIGQDSVQVAQYQNQLHWFWGDTSRLSYPLGMFRTSGAISALPSASSLHHSEGFDLRYFKNDNEFVRPMVQLAEKEGVVWIDGVYTVHDDNQSEKLIAHYSRRKGLGQQLSHGMVLYDDDTHQFLKETELAEEQNWQHLSNHPITVQDGKETYLQSGTPFPLTRVPANLAAVLDPEQYESWSCLSEDGKTPLRTSSGKLDFQWRQRPPVTPKLEAKWLKNGTIQSEEAIISPVDASDRKRHLQIHTGCVYWNEYRQRWIMIASEINWSKESSSHLGEIWYSEAESPQGPFRITVRILTHNNQSFYNACHHPFLNEKNGQLIYFEGTYTNMFTNAPATPRYDYNQMMYRLDLGIGEIDKVFGKAPEDENIY